MVLGMVQAWYRHGARHGTGMVQAWCRHGTRHGTGMVQAWYRHGTGMVQAWYRHGTDKKLMEAGGKMYRKLKFCLDSVGNPHFYFKKDNLYSKNIFFGPIRPKFQK